MMTKQIEIIDDGDSEMFLMTEPVSGGCVLVINDYTDKLKASVAMNRQGVKHLIKQLEELPCLT